MLVSLNNVTFGYAGVPIAREVTFEIHEKERVGLIGANGAGKTTLIRIMLGQLVPDEGQVLRKNGARFGYLEQSGGFESGSTVYGAMEEVFARDKALILALNEAQTRIGDASGEEFTRLSARIESLNREIAARDSYHFDVRIKTVLGGMGFDKVYDQRVDTMSGGEKTKLKLCRLLLEEPDLLILDEPTNHLDVKTLFWLEDYLAGYKGALFVVSHDRYFLDKLTTRTLETENGKLYSYKGNYSKYRILRQERYENELREYTRVEEELRKLQDYVDRNIVRATTARSAQSRVKKIEKLTLPPKPLPPPAPPRFSFTFTERPYEQVLSIEHFDLAADDKQLLRDASLTVMRREKCALVGDNGTGKSTLLKFLLRDARVKFGKFVKIAYYDQENADLDQEERVLDAFWGKHSLLSQTDARKLLAQAGIAAEDIDKKVKELSGGMRAKLELALLVARHGNFLILDEPTNHLDLPAREALEEALRAFEGTILFVSHDRRFIESIATRVVSIENKSLLSFAGSYREFLARKLPQPEAPKQEKQEKSTAGYRSREERAREAQQRNRIKEIENRLAELEEEESSLNDALAANAADYAKVRELTARLSAAQQEIEALYEEYGTLIG